MPRPLLIPGLSDHDGATDREGRVAQGEADKRVAHHAALQPPARGPAAREGGPFERASPGRRLRLPPAIAAWLGLPWPARWRWLGRKLFEVARGSSRIDSPDRVVLERDILPAYAADTSLRQLLFVGCERYTRHYMASFAPGIERFRTLDIDPRKSRFGSTHHIVAALQDVEQHLAPASVDAIVCNGVYGFGIDDREELARALRACCGVLRPGGSLVLGWNDVAGFAPFDPCEVALGAGLVRDATVMGTWRMVTDTPTRHTFDAYVRAPATPVELLA